MVQVAPRALSVSNSSRVQLSLERPEISIWNEEFRFSEPPGSGAGRDKAGVPEGPGSSHSDANVLVGDAVDRGGDALLSRQDRCSQV